MHRNQPRGKFLDRKYCRMYGLAPGLGEANENFSAIAYCMFGNISENFCEYS